jgi:hypothetical protein
MRPYRPSGRGSERQPLWEAVSAVERPQTAGDAHKQAQTYEREHGAHKQACRRGLDEQPSIGSRWLRGVLAEASRTEDFSGRAVCAAS